MFKKNHCSKQPLAARDDTHRALRPWPCVFLLFITCLTGCQIFPHRLPPDSPLNQSADLSQPGWTIRQGQAVWRSKKNAPEIAGELLVATNINGRAFVQFTKTPLPLLAAQFTTNEWLIHSIPDDQTFSGRGKPPVRALWLWLPLSLAGEPAPKSLSWQSLENNRWHLENRRTGESLEGYLSP